MRTIYCDAHNPLRRVAPAREICLRLDVSEYSIRQHKYAIRHLQNVTIRMIGNHNAPGLGGMAYESFHRSTVDRLDFGERLIKNQI